MMLMSGPRTLWIVGVFALTFVATVLGHGFAHDDGGFGASIAFVAVAASMPLLLFVHELGHGLAALLVGCRGVRIGVTPTLDGWTSWEAGTGSARDAREIVALAAGPFVTLAAAAALVLPCDLQGLAGGWRAGLATFAVLLTADVLAPIPKDGVQRDGYAISEILRTRRADRGDHGAAINAALRRIEAHLWAGETRRSRALAWRVLTAGGENLDPRAWAAIAARVGVADLVSGDDSSITETRWAIGHAIVLAPSDPVVRAVAEAVRVDLATQDSEVVTTSRTPTRCEVRLLGLIQR
jgi:hypothetical protein